MSSEEILVNWPLFIVTSFVIIARRFGPSICIYFRNKILSQTTNVEQLTKELREVNEQIKTISQQDEFAAYARKERQRNALSQRLKDEKSNIELKQKTFSMMIQIILNVFAVILMIYLTFTGQKHGQIPLFNFPFFRFPFLLWIMAFNTFITAITDIYSRFQTNKNKTD